MLNFNNKICKTYTVLTKYLTNLQNMYDFGEISLTCLTKYAFSFLIRKIMTNN
jgi:hypothetical protein